MALQWLILGAVTPNSARVTARLTTAGTVRIAVSTKPAMTSPVYSASVVADANFVAKVNVTGLTPNTQYWYSAEINGVLDAQVGQLWTFPPEGTRTSLVLVHGSCAGTGATSPIFSAMAARKPRMMIHLGDMHYDNVDVNDQNVYLASYDKVLAAPSQAQLYRDVPLVYMWDDHDFGNNNSNTTNPGRPAISAVYRQIIPSYDLPAGSGDNPIYHAFTYGRARIIMTDLRHDRSPDGNVDNASKTMLGATQKAWFKNELAQAVAADQFVIWGNTQVWPVSSGPGNLDNDHWGVFSTERRELANYIKSIGLKKIVILSGDAHMLIWDDGTNSDYADGGGASIPVFQAAAMASVSAAIRGEAWSGGTPVGGPNHYGVLQIVEDDLGWHLDWLGIEINTSTSEETILFTAHLSWPHAVSRADTIIKSATGTSYAPLRVQGPSGVAVDTVSYVKQH